MAPPPHPRSAALFAFDEADHLTRIHLKLALEDIGFVVAERDVSLSLHDPAPDADAPAAAPSMNEAAPRDVEDPERKAPQPKDRA